MDRVVTIYINREQEAVVVKARSPPAGGGGDGAREASQSNENFQNAIANIVQTPSFIGVNATCKLIDLSQRSS